MPGWLPLKTATFKNGIVHLQKANQLVDVTGNSLMLLFYQFSDISLSSLPPISTIHMLKHYLLEVQDYLENSCDPELKSPAKRNTTD